MSLTAHHYGIGVPIDWQTPVLGWDYNEAITCAKDMVTFMNQVVLDKCKAQAETG